MAKRDYKPVLELLVGGAIGGIILNEGINLSLKGKLSYDAAITSLLVAGIGMTVAGYFVPKARNILLPAGGVNIAVPALVRAGVLPIVR